MIYSNPLYPNQKIQTQQYFEEEDIPRIPDFRFKMNYVISYQIYSLRAITLFDHLVLSYS